LQNNSKFESRPWGYFVILHDDSDTKVKRIAVYPNSKLSYQSHRRRDETWIIISGRGYCIIDDVIQRVGAGTGVKIKNGQKHRIANDYGDEPLIFIEVQTGEYFGEDDIERYSDEYGRV